MKKIINYKEKGVTLIALTITIIVLLILAGITLGAVTGENGLIEKSKETIGKYENLELTEQEKISDLYEQLNTNNTNGENTDHI